MKYQKDNRDLKSKNVLNERTTREQGKVNTLVETRTTEMMVTRLAKLKGQDPTM